MVIHHKKANILFDKKRVLMKHFNYFLILGLFFLFCTKNFGYDLPYLDLGVTNILDGGPIRPTPGWYLFGDVQYYYSNNFVDQNGNTLAGLSNPQFYAWAIIPALAYQSDRKIVPGAVWGVMAKLPIIPASGINRNELGITDSDAGFGDLLLGAYLQWDPIFLHDRPFFVHRLEFNTTFPTGKYKGNGTVINPGNNIFSIETYWAATWYIVPKLAASWRIYYLHCFENHANNRQGGDAIHLNYALSYEVLKGLHWAVNGYFLQQITDSKLCGVKVPDSKERVFAVGPGLCYFISEDNVLFAHLYFESDVRNRPKGISAFVSFVKHF